MRSNTILTLCLILNVGHAIEPEQRWEAIVNRRFAVDSSPLRGDSGSKLLLSPYLQSGNVDRAQELARVDTEHMIDGIESYAGYITVDPAYNSSLWFWYFPAQEISSESTPLVLWLQGGPGASSLFGLFEELGPFTVDSEGVELIENPHSWHKNYSLLFIDNPVGTGFSFTDSEEGYATNQTQIGEQLYIFMEQFVRLFPDIQEVPFYITGESYAGKHIPSLAYEIHKRNPAADVKINLQGLAIGNGFIDPQTMMAYSLFAQQIGIADDNLVEKMSVFEKRAESAMRAGRYLNAYYYFSYVLNDLYEQSQMDSIYNFVYEDALDIAGPFTTFIQRPEIRKALHVGNTKFTSIGKVYRKLVPDFMTSAKPWLEELLEHYKVLGYSGQMDIICAYPLSVRTYRSLQWGGATEYLLASRMPWYHEGKLAGYVKKAGNFTEVLVRNAGHMVPTDQPERSLKLLTSFIENIPLETSNSKE